ncbi:hypothetical protein HELRODRAFT_169882 [Helobdella robusta]|uniref:Cilia- and flagella-associated protein 45 n=1 Tax=Helobdella robusta TaxID=6412 RepID=T1F2E4_HELRO|nr:hypothetical protein HELRODRAFT_169882 [Helobdella robusta]ESO08144.1 hypothetical protein HELRODRAFT_169882 [Helobdella robusta]
MAIKIYSLANVLRLGITLKLRQFHSNSNERNLALRRGLTQIERQADERNKTRRSISANVINNNDDDGDVTVNNRYQNNDKKFYQHNNTNKQSENVAKPLIMDRESFERLMCAATINYQQVLQRQKHEEQLRKEQLLMDAQARKEHIKDLDRSRKQNTKLTEFELEEQEKNEFMKKKALEMLTEQEEEIKELNGLILDAKCQIIRNAQIAEKQAIQREMENEERKMEMLMELERVNAQKAEDDLEKRKREEKMIGALNIRQQIEQNEQEKLLELERKDQENRIMQKYLDQLCEEEIEKIKKKKIEQLKLRTDLKNENENIIKRKEISKIEEQILDQQILEFQNAKAEREAILERERLEARAAKEREIARLRSLQERKKDELAERDELRAKRAQEQNEREWRKKEAEAAARKAAIEAALNEAREQQLKQKQISRAMQAQWEKKDFERVLRAQMEQIEKMKKEEENVKIKRGEFSNEIKNQIREKERTKILERSKFFEEGIKLSEEAKQRKEKVDQVKLKKLQELRDAGIEEKYLVQIEKKINNNGSGQRIIPPLGNI